MDEKFSELMKEMEDGEICNRCRAERHKVSEFYEKDLEGTGRGKAKHTKLCPIYPGFGSNNFLKKERVDVLIIAESHGGGDWEEGLHMDIHQRAKKSYEYHKSQNIDTFFQWNIKQITDALDKGEISWFVTDLVKCYVFRNKSNFGEAIDFCKKYLIDQVSILKPRLGVILGKSNDSLIKDILRKGGVDENKIKSFQFPSARNADRWAKFVGDYTVVVEYIKGELSKIAE